MNLTALEYIKVLASDKKALLALLTCSAALRLDDEVAKGAIELVVKSNGSTIELLRCVKTLGCVWKQWDRSWYIAEDVRRDFVDELYKEVPLYTLSQLREYFIEQAKQRTKNLTPQDEVTVYWARQAEFEAAYHQMLIPEQSESGAAQITKIWQAAPQLVKKATADSVDYLAEEIARHLKRLPPDVLFLQGMAARARKGREAKKNQLKYFRAVYEIGLSKKDDWGYIYGIAAHLYGLLLRNVSHAKEAFLNSIAWYGAADHQAQVYNSLGKLLSEDKKTWQEAEGYFKKSIELRFDRGHQGKVYNSLGKLLSKDSLRWPEAVKSYEKSLELRDNPKDKALVLTSWADLLLEFDTAEAYAQAEKFAETSIKLDPDNFSTVGMCHRILAIVYEHQGKFNEAIKSLEVVQDINRKLGIMQFENLISEKIASLRQGK